MTTYPSSRCNMRREKEVRKNARNRPESVEAPGPSPDTAIVLRIRISSNFLLQSVETQIHREPDRSVNLIYLSQQTYYQSGRGSYNTHRNFIFVQAIAGKNKYNRSLSAHIIATTPEISYPLSIIIIRRGATQRTRGSRAGTSSFLNQKVSRSPKLKSWSSRDPRPKTPFTHATPA